MIHLAIVLVVAYITFVVIYYVLPRIIDRNRKQVIDRRIAAKEHRESVKRAVQEQYNRKHKSARSTLETSSRKLKDDDAAAAVPNVIQALNLFVHKTDDDVRITTRVLKKCCTELESYIDAEENQHA